MGPATAVQLGNIQQQPLATNNSNANANHVGVMVDPELMGQGMDEELQKMAGEAIAHSTAAMHHAQQGQCGGDGDGGGEDENERELRTRLGGFIDGGGGGGVSGGDGGVVGGEMMHQSAA
jgi:hypothetical protein